jgi:L-asparaginase
MKRILLIATGGTIASRPSENGLKPAASVEALLAKVPEIHEFCKADAVQLFNIDSTNITPAHWIALVKAIKENYEKYDGFVVCHGTDTMAYTAAALSYMIQNSPKPIVLTGSQQPIEKEDTDARVNLRDSFSYACSDKATGVTIVFQGKVIAGTRAKKIRTKSYDAFESVDFPALANIRDGKIISYITSPKGDKPEFSLELGTKVGLLTLTPGVRAELLDAYFHLHDAVIVSGYGAGGIPEAEYYGFFEVLQKWSDKGKTLVVTTQVQHEGSDMSVYQVGRGWKNKFDLLEGYALTYEAIVTKLMWILGKTQKEEEIKALFYKTINYDLIG